MLKHQKSYPVSSWSSWKKDIDLSVKAFFAEFSVYPNLLQANEHTASQIDVLVNFDASEREKIVDIRNGGTPPEGEEIVLSGFSGKEYDLDFALDDQLPDMTIRLIFDDNPQWEDSAPKHAPKMMLQLKEAQ